MIEFLENLEESQYGTDFIVNEEEVFELSECFVKLGAYLIKNETDKETFMRNMSIAWDSAPTATTHVVPKVKA